MDHCQKKSPKRNRKIPDACPDPVPANARNLCFMSVKMSPSLSLSGWLEQIDTNSEIGTRHITSISFGFGPKEELPVAMFCLFACGQNMSQTTRLRGPKPRENWFSGAPNADDTNQLLPAG